MESIEAENKIKSQLQEYIFSRIKIPTYVLELNGKVSVFCTVSLIAFNLSDALEGIEKKDLSKLGRSLATIGVISTTRSYTLMSAINGLIANTTGANANNFVSATFLPTTLIVTIFGIGLWLVGKFSKE